MKKLFLIMGIIAVMALITLPVSAANTWSGAPGSAPPGTLYQQEGQSPDGPANIDATGRGPNGNDSDNWTNWKWQEGSGSWSGVYKGNGWLTEAEDGDMSLDVEADIEMYCSETISGNKIYFHLGNVLTATDVDKTAYVNGTYASNHGMWIGISFPGKPAENFEKVGDLYTGKILGGMVSDRHTYGAQTETMDIMILMNWGDGFKVPGNYGEGAHGTIQDTLWWRVNNGTAGSYTYQWLVKILPTAYQPDGDYHLDPKIVSTPVL